MVRREIGDDGVLPIPNAINQASWWGAGIDAPSGATVLAGHINWKGATGPFAELWDSRVGDQMSIVDGSGRPVAYRVTQVITLQKDELPRRAEELFAQTGPHRLVLVTCGGQWVGGRIGYASNQIVIATPA
jgi:LPXTG-site transpeptidase (sortase) family protein